MRQLIGRHADADKGRADRRATPLISIITYSLAHDFLITKKTSQSKLRSSTRPTSPKSSATSTLDGMLVCCPSVKRRKLRRFLSAGTALRKPTQIASVLEKGGRGKAACCHMCHFMCHGFASMAEKSPETLGNLWHTLGTRAGSNGQLVHLLTA